MTRDWSPSLRTCTTDMIFNPFQGPSTGTFHSTFLTPTTSPERSSLIFRRRSRIQSADNTRFSTGSDAPSFPLAGADTPPPRARRSHRGPSRYVDIKGNPTATRIVSLTHWHGHWAYVGSFSLSLSPLVGDSSFFSHELPLKCQSLLSGLPVHFHLSLSRYYWSCLPSDRLLDGRSGRLFFLSVVGFRFAIRCAAVFGEVCWGKGCCYSVAQRLRGRGNT